MQGQRMRQRFKRTIILTKPSLIQNPE